MRIFSLIVSLSGLAIMLVRPVCATIAPPDSLVLDESSAAGVKWEFKPEAGTDWKPIAVPAGGWRAQGYTCDEGLYRAAILIPRGIAGKAVRLKFAAVNFGADVYAGKSEADLTKVASHIDGWVPFAADLTPYAAPGGTVVVQVDVKGRRKFMFNGKYTVPEGATWYPGLEEGILRGVHLEVVPMVRIEDLFAATHVGPDTLIPKVTIANDTASQVVVQIAARLSSADRASFPYPAIPMVTAGIQPHSRQEVALGAVAWTAGPKSYWWPNVPYRQGYRAKLHLLDATLLINGRAVHTYRQRFGFRQFAAVGNHYELNGVRCNLRGDNQQEANFGTDAYGIRPGFGPPSAANAGWPQAVDNLLHLNFNVMRLHQIPATPYMLDVCDEKGLMLVEESPLRGSEGGEDYGAGRANMLNMDRELVLRDRNHPAVVIWSAANEWSEPIRDAMQIIRTVDFTRPIIADGVGDMGPDVINMEHYVNGGGLPQRGGSPRADRPYGETEAVWSNDNSRQGFAWMATGVRLRRLKGDSDLRNYVLNNAWSNYVPGEDDKNEVLEIRVKGSPNATILPALSDPWSDPNIRLMMQCYHPLAACDIDFDRVNARSNRNGDWPVVKPRLAPGAHVVRKIAVFNDEFAGESVTLRWEARSGSPAGPVLAQGILPLTIPLGQFRALEIAFDAPQAEGDLALLLTTSKNGLERFHEDQIRFAVTAHSDSAISDGDYRLINANSGLPARAGGEGAPPEAVVQGVTGPPDAQIWHLKLLPGGDVTLINRATGHALTVATIDGGNGALAVERAATGAADQVWQLTDLEDGGYTLANKATGKLLDVYGSAAGEGAKIVQWEANGGENQRWQLKRVDK